METDSAINGFSITINPNLVIKNLPVPLDNEYFQKLISRIYKQEQQQVDIEIDRQVEEFRELWTAFLSLDPAQVSKITLSLAGDARLSTLEFLNIFKLNELTMFKLQNSNLTHISLFALQYRLQCPGYSNSLKQHLISPANFSPLQQNANTNQILIRKLPVPLVDVFNHIEQCGLKNLGFLERMNLPFLSRLNVGYNQISDISPLVRVKLPLLQNLYLDNVGMKNLDWTLKFNFKNIRKLDIFNYDESHPVTDNKAHSLKLLKFADLRSLQLLVVDHRLVMDKKVLTMLDLPKLTRLQMNCWTISDMRVFLKIKSQKVVPYLRRFHEFQDMKLRQNRKLPS